MCDSDDVHADLQKAPPPPIDPTKYDRKRVPGMCVKCKVANPNITIRRSLYCKECFVRACIVKFRTATNRSRKNSPATTRTKLMVALSGGPSSSAMLRMMADFQCMHIKGTAAQPLYEDVVAGHIDETALFPDVRDSLICDIAANADIECKVAKLEDVFCRDREASAFMKTVSEVDAPNELKDRIRAQLVKPDESASSKDQLQSLFSGLATVTDREEMLDVLKTIMLVELARKEKCGVLLVGDSGTRIATKIVSLASRGRGFSLPFEVGAESSWFSDVLVYRPMRDFIMKEIAFFNQWTNQSIVVVPTFTTGAPMRTSIGRLTESFVVGLDRDFASTVSTICRTMQKLEPQQQALDALPCLVCKMPVEKDAQEWRSRLTVSQGSATELAGRSKTSAAGSFCNKEDSVSADITSLVCYSCQNIVHSAAPGTLFPSGNASSYKHSIHQNSTQDSAAMSSTDSGSKQEHLRKQIEMFFIADDE
ncbi:Cytoplasmic tRNA 2-thiolation protein 2 [Coemansia sp. RSA 1813]|nr:Cytoplasmic tRNA 2-thiolation protein 2 [Coemansia sp. RSA 1646]KAJ1769550.1 Cytoplasmic tRNA 2-thiolation protein 2 [Coemansia sp. RSA 1843]KAJ2090490.1 Cytoplasmic tRNA 2-thiolation protein 2 [Coemansia sp. RSA 986]KAJ2215456.1 Cytoplasmic tRNA 2-thiolation protein 2 [Coemansia sp. RSA 487]KAJ2570043.1 Cytoplasmic tRNA 2-thiolation protein 2 [Coemansia sp. RSA 1813]